MCAEVGEKATMGDTEEIYASLCVAGMISERSEESNRG